MKREKRIWEMEERFDLCRGAVSELALALERYEGALGELGILTDYYEGGLWLEDFEADEAGELPPELKRGVLSEDGVYDLLQGNGELETSMLGVLKKLSEMRNG